MATVAIGMARGVPAVTLGAGEMAATFLPGVGMVGVSLRHRGEELLTLPHGLSGYRAGHVAGLPLLAPWANRVGNRRFRVAGVEVDLEGLDLHTDENGLPIHGTMTAQAGWEIVRAAAEQSTPRAELEARFNYGARPDLLAAFPFPHQLRLAIALEPEALSVATTVVPTSDCAVPVAFGWHPYFRLPGARRRSWRLVLPRRRHLTLDDRGLPTGEWSPEDAEAEPIHGRTFDDLYALDGADTLALEGGGRRITVAYQERYPYAQVFVPPGKEFACLEPMTAPTNALVTGTCPLAEPGAQFTARFAVHVS